MSQPRKPWWQRYPWSALIGDKPTKFPELNYDPKEIKKALLVQRERRTIRVKSKLP